ncbi:MAG: hypothetical protein QMC80_05560 [Thermoplasmatales archaeon]|nr:hypothetical protein [Thermoplasmatales archaeon]
MRRVLVCILILVVVFSLMYSPVNADENKINIYLEVNFDEENHATIIFSMGTHIPGGVRQIPANDWNKEWAGYISTLPNGTLEKHIATQLNSSTDGFVKNVLGVGGKVTVNSILAANDSNGIYIKMRAIISDTTLHPLSFLGTEYGVEKIDEIANIKVKITSSNAILEPPVIELIVFHYRLPTGEYMEYSSTTNTINVNTNPFFSPLGAFIMLIVFAVSGISICLYGRKYMRGTKLGIEMWVLAFIFYFCAFIPLSIYLVYVFIGLGLVLSFARMLKAIRVSKPKAKPKKTPASVSGEAVEKYLGKPKKPKPKKATVDEEAERAYIDLSKYSDFRVIPKTGEVVKKEEEKKEEVKEKPKIDIASLLQLGRKKKEEEKGKEEKTFVKMMEKKGFKKAEDKDA